MIHKLTLMISLIAPIACNAGGGNLSGGRIDTRNVKADPTSKGGTVYSGEAKPEKPASSIDELEGESAELPGPKESKPVASTPQPKPVGEDLSIPIEITGSLLHCSYDSKKDNTVTTLCQLRDEKTKKPIRVSERFKDITWSALQPEMDVTYEVQDLTARNGFWHAKYVFKGPSNFYDRIASKMTFAFYATETATNRKVKKEDKLASQVRSFFRIQSQRPHNAEPLRCLDFYFDTDADHKGTTGTCTASQGQRFHFNADNSIGVFIENENQCVTFDPGNTTAQYVVPQPCNAMGLPRPIIVWELQGQEMRIRGQNNCLSLTPDQPDPSNDYIGIQTCNGAEQQRWEILPF